MTHFRKKIIHILCAIFLLLFLLYWILVYFLVSAALVPSFMKKLDAFDEITVKSYAEQIHTDDISTNHATAIQATREWYSATPNDRLTVTSLDGYTFVACQFLQPNYSNRWVLLLHGYTGWKEEMYPFAYWYYENGYNVLVPDLRCQGESEGDFIGMGWTDHYDCMLWLDYILSQNEEATIVLHGQSMGAATALMMSGDSALPENVCAIISDCAYTDAYSMFGDKCRVWFSLPAFPLVDSACLMLCLRGGYNLKDASALLAVQKSTTPTLFIHGKDDAMISASMSVALYDAASCPKELLLVDGAGHAQAQDKAPDTYYDTIYNFLEQYVRY